LAFPDQQFLSGHVRERTATDLQEGDGLGNAAHTETGLQQGNHQMTRTSAVVTIAILSSILTPVVVKATGTTSEQSAAVQQATVETTTPARSSEPACTRTVKVVYGGFSEAHAAACAASASLRH
jgi:hypothetical protein